jgi:ribosomal protein S18 acetylase RimI-like enzyme
MIRAYSESDWDQVSAIYDLAKPDEMEGIVDADAITPLAEDGRMLRYFFDSKIWVCEDNGCILGFIGQKGDLVSWLFVHPDHRRKGIAGRLLNELIRAHQGPLRLNLAKSNRPAMALYTSLGFEISEEFEGNMYGCAVPAVSMTLSQEKTNGQSHGRDAGKPCRR